MVVLVLGVDQVCQFVQEDFDAALQRRSLVGKVKVVVGAADGGSSHVKRSLSAMVGHLKNVDVLIQVVFDNVISIVQIFLGKRNQGQEFVKQGKKPGEWGTVIQKEQIFVFVTYIIKYLMYCILD